MSDNLRFRRRTLRTPIHRYAHPDTGRQITVIGMMHVGEPAYFERLREVIDTLEAAGAVVQREGSGRVPGDDHDLTDDEQTVLDLMDHQHVLEKRRITELGWVHQHDAFGDQPHRPKIDMGRVELIRRIGVDTMLGNTMRSIKMFDQPDTDPRSIERFRLKQHLYLRLFPVVVAAAQSRARNTDPSHDIDTVLLDERNTIALNGVRSTNRDVVLTWGCAHLPGLATGLLTDGYTRTGTTEWHTAITLPRIPTILWRIATGHTPDNHGSGRSAACETAVRSNSR